MEDGGDGKLKSGRLQRSSAIFKVKWPTSPIALKLSQNIVKCMAYIVDQLYVDLRQGGCLYKPTSGIQ